LASVNVDFLVQNCSFLRYLVIKKLQILNFTKESDENGVEVDSEESLGCNWGLLSYQQVLIEFLFSRLLNTGLPLLNLLVFELSQVLA
jgi:hypothetical protein